MSAKTDICENIIKICLLIMARYSSLPRFKSINTKHVIVKIFNPYYYTQCDQDVALRVDLDCEFYVKEIKPISVSENSRRVSYLRY